MTARRPIAGALALTSSAVVLLFPSGGAYGASALEGASAIAFLNQQRAANGIPPITTINQGDAQSWCPNEDAPGASGIVSFGADAWGADTSPWDNGPLHQGAEYDPLVMTAGEVNVDGNACLGFGKQERVPPSTPTAYAFVGDEGPRNVPTMRDVVNELPFSPQELVGIPAGRTGPQPIFYIYGLGTVHAAQWSLKTVTGQAVPNVKMVDSRAPGLAHYPGWHLSERAFLVPPPLRNGTSYVITVEWQGSNGLEISQVVPFATELASNNVDIYVARGIVHAESLARGGKAVLSRSGRKVRVRLTSKSYGYFRATLPVSRLTPGRWRACVSSGGGTSGYVARTRCVTVRVS